MFNYRHPCPRREWKGGSDLQSDPPFLVDPLEPVDPAQNSGRLMFAVIYNVFCTFCRKIITIFGVELLGALLAPRWPQMRSGPPVELHLEASWSLCWRQDGPSGAKMSQVGIKLAVKFGKLRTKRRILYIHKLPIHRKAATML